MHPCCKLRKENFCLAALYGVVGSDTALYLVHCATRKSQEPHAHYPLCTPILAAIYLDGLPTPITDMSTCATACLGPVLVPIARPHQRMKACKSNMGACVLVYRHASVACVSCSLSCIDD